MGDLPTGQVVVKPGPVQQAPQPVRPRCPSACASVQQSRVSSSINSPATSSAPPRVPCGARSSPRRLPSPFRASRPTPAQLRDLRKATLRRQPQLNSGADSRGGAWRLEAHTHMDRNVSGRATQCDHRCVLLGTRAGLPHPPIGSNGRARRGRPYTDHHRSPALLQIRATLNSGWLCMAAVSPIPDPARPEQGTSDLPAAPQHRDLFLQPQYTVDLPSLDEDEDTFSGPPPSTQRRHGVTRSR